MIHTAAYYASANPAGALTLIAAVADQSIFTSGNDVRVPTGLNQLLGEAALSAATGPLYGQVQSPSLRTLANQDVKPIAAAAKFGATDQVQWHGKNPRQLETAESINFAIQATGGAAAANYGLIWLGDGPVNETKGKVFSVRATGSAALSAGAWVNTALAFDTVLPAGSYQVVGLRAEGANLIAARFSFVGQGFRPGVAAEPSSATNYFRMFRSGYVGVYGQFDVDQPPTIDCLGATDTSQEFVLDLIKVR